MQVYNMNQWEGEKKGKAFRNFPEDDSSYMNSKSTSISDSIKEME